MLWHYYDEIQDDEALSQGIVMQLAIARFLEKSLLKQSSFTYREDSIVTTFQKEVVAGDQVVVALTHVAKDSNHWNGFDVSSRDVTWTSLTYFRFNNEGKIVEEIVECNELHMSHQLWLTLSDKR